MTTQILDLNNIERKLFWILTGSLGVVLAIYFYASFSLMGSVVARDRISSLSHNMSISSVELEQEYLGLKNSITLARARELGFSEVPVKFITASSLDDSNLSTRFSYSR